jgi:hypothetical protein
MQNIWSIISLTQFNFKIEEINHEKKGEKAAKGKGKAEQRNKK